MSKLSFRLMWGAPIIAILVSLFGGCDTAMSTSKDKDQMEPSPEMDMEPSEYLRGTWRYSEPWGEDGIQGTKYRTLTFTKSRFIDANAEVLDDGTVHNEWQHPGTWDATADTITKTWHRWIEGEGRDQNKTVENRSYAWVDDDRTILLLQEWDADADRQPVYREYRQVPPIDPYGVWRRLRVHEARGKQVWEIDATGPIVTWSYTDEYPYSHTISGPARVNVDELYLLVDAETHNLNGEEHEMSFVGHSARFAFAPGHNADTIAVSEPWRELERQDDGTWVDREDLPYGEYHQFYVRVVEM